jgi:hypothetical protein
VPQSFGGELAVTKTNVEMFLVLPARAVIFRNNLLFVGGGGEKTGFFYFMLNK